MLLTNFALGFGSLQIYLIHKPQGRTIELIIIQFRTGRMFQFEDSLSGSKGAGHDNIQITVEFQRLFSPPREFISKRALILDVSVFHSFLAAIFKLGIVGREFVPTDGTGTMSIEPVHGTMRMKRVSTRKTGNTAVDFVRFGAYRAFAVIFVNGRESQMQQRVDGTQRCRGNSTVWLLLYTMHVVMII
jgi:hypothetical protein